VSDDHGHSHGDEKKESPAPTNTVGGLSREQLLVMYGFVRQHHKDDWKGRVGKYNTEAKRRQAVKKLSKDTIEKWADREKTEVVDEAFSLTDYPGNGIRYRIIFESATEGIEESYFNVLELARSQFGMPVVHKVSDYFTASENSAFFGNSQQRLGIQQDRVQQFLGNIGKFVKELFQMVRELRIIDERLAIYEASGGLTLMDHGQKKKDEHGHAVSAVKRSHAADVTLKSIFTDLVEGGTKNPQSVFGLASQVNFTLLPDLFFNEYVDDKDQVDAVVDRMQYNKSLKAVLKRKLYQYLVWKEKTYHELVHRKRFNLKYLRQHWAIIQMYMKWAKPYLRNIERLTMNQGQFESPDIIAAFETSVVEVEFIATKPKAKDGYYPIVLASFFFRTRPDMSVRKEYQQGPAHLGRMDLNIRAYAWTEEQLAAYRNMKKREEIELLGLLDGSLSAIMESLGEDFEVYLAAAGEEIVHDEPEPADKPKQEGALAPFVSVAKGVKEMVEAFLPTGGGHDDHDHGHNSPKSAMGDATRVAGLIYTTFKKQKRMITW
jgi:hypothetical protein